MLTNEEAKRLSDAARAQGANGAQIRAILVAANERATADNQARVDAIPAFEREESAAEKVANRLGPLLTTAASAGDAATFGLGSRLADVINPGAREASTQVREENPISNALGLATGLLGTGVAAGGARLLRGLAGAAGRGAKAAFGGTRTARILNAVRGVDQAKDSAVVANNVVQQTAPGVLEALPQSKNLITRLLGGGADDAIQVVNQTSNVARDAARAAEIARAQGVARQAQAAAKKAADEAKELAQFILN